MTVAPTISALPQRRPRSGPGTWPRYYCDPDVSPKHAKGRASPRTSPERAPRSQQLDLSVVREIAAVLGPHERHQEPSHIVADVLLRLLPMPDCARSTIAIVVHRRGTGTCDDLTYNQAGALGDCDRRTAINRFARTEGYGFIRVEQRDYPYGGAAPNLVTAKIPAWVYDQVDAYRAVAPILQPVTAPSAVAAESAPGAPGAVLTEVVPAAAVKTTAASPSSASSAAPAASASAEAAGEKPSASAETEPVPAARVLPPGDAEIAARLDEIHAFTRERFEVAAVRGLNQQVPKFMPGAGVPKLDDQQILAALDEYIKKQQPAFERKAKYGKRLPDRLWVERGIHAYLWGKRVRLDGLDERRVSGRRKRRSGGAASRQEQASVPVRLTPAAAPVRLGITFEPASTIVSAVEPGSIAASLLLQPGDKLIAIDRQAVRFAKDVGNVLAIMQPGLHTFDMFRACEAVSETIMIEPRGPPAT